jgi:hypothetical protein
MRNHLKILLLVLSLVLPRVVHAVGDSCECPKLSCNKECEIEQDLTFYSEKCDGGKRVRSCARPTCVALENAPAVCALGKKTEAAVTSEPVRAVASEPVIRAVPVKSLEESKQAIGHVKYIEGSAHRVLTDGNRSQLKPGEAIYEKDRIATTADGKVQIHFLSGNFLNITPQSEVVVLEASDSISSESKKRMVLDLIRGKIRNKVEKKYEGSEQSFYRVRTKAAVAGVRGTDFSVSYDESGENVTSKIETLEGQVELSDRGFEKKVLIARNEAASFVADKKTLFNDRDVAEFVAKGYLTPVYKMSEKQVKDLEHETGFARFIAGSDAGSDDQLYALRAKVKKQDAPICAAPEGALNQCSWSCENNPSGEKRCRTDLPNVSCVRRICNANGLWSQPTRLPASYHDSCISGRPVVKPCDY